MTDGAKLAIEDARSLNYFWKEKQDISKYSRFNDLNLHRDAPHVAKAWHEYLEAERRLTLELAALELEMEKQETS